MLKISRYVFVALSEYALLKSKSKKLSFIGDHKLKPIEAVTEIYQENMARLREKLYYKIKRCHQNEKAAWKNLSEIEGQIDGIHRRIDTVKQELVSLIKEYRKVSHTPSPDTGPLNSCDTEAQ